MIRPRRRVAHDFTQPRRTTADILVKMNSMIRGRPSGCVLLLAATAVVMASSCARWAQEPRFGSRPRDERPFSFAHNIQLLEVSNGLRVALIRDNRTNLATVDMRYDVGAAEDPIGRAGLAHLVEHLLFELRGRPGGPTLGEELGELALDHNAFTSWDMTHYTATVPIAGLEAAIALESRRMRATCDDLDDATFLRERDVVLAEEKEGRSALADVMREVLADVYGPGHPYTRAIASPEVATATRDEACAFVARHYTPDRAFLVITGPFDAAATRAQIGRAFGPIIRGASAPRAPVGKPRLGGGMTRRTAPVARPTALVYLPYPATGADGAVKFALARAALETALEAADDSQSWITRTAVSVSGGDRAPVLVAEVEVADAARLEDAADEVFVRAGTLLDGVTPRELSARLGAMVLSHLQGWDDLPGRGRWIADFMQFTTHDRFMLMELSSINDTDWRVAIDQLRTTLTQDRSHIVLLTPATAGGGTKLTNVAAATHQLVPWRAPVDPAAADRPLTVDRESLSARVEQYQLANGLNVQLAHDPRSPIVDARLVFPVGSAHEPPDRPYLATAAARLLSGDSEGFYSRRDLDKLEWSTSHGTQLDARVAETSTTFSASGVAQWGDWHVWYLSWWVDQGRYNQPQIDAMHQAARARSADHDDDEIDPVARAFGERLFGARHPYALPAPERGAAYLRLGAADLERWKRGHYRARGATLIVSGAFDAAAMKRAIEELFGPWSAAAPADLPPIPPVRASRGPSWLAGDDGDAVQTRIAIGFATTSDPDRDEAARAVLAEMMGDAMRDVREGMGASYGIHASYASGAAGGALLVYGDVDDARAGAALTRMLAALAAVRDGGDDQRAAFVRARRKILARSLGRTGGAAAIADELTDQAAAGQSLSHANIVATQISALTPAQVARIAATDLDLTRMVVLVRGRRAAVDATYAAIAITPERPVVDQPAAPTAAAGDGGGATARPPAPRPAPAAPEPDRRPHRTVTGPRLSVGGPEGLIGSKQRGLFLGDRKLTLDEFLRTAGSADVLGRMRTRRWVRRGLILGAVVAAATGVVMQYTARDCTPPPGLSVHPEAEACEAGRNAIQGQGFAIFAGGAVVGAITSQLGSERPDDEELRRIAAHYNRVGAGHGGDDHGGDDQARSPSISVAPMATSGGGGLVLSTGF